MRRQSQRNFRELPPLSLYVHLPWCVAKCPYCDFNSHTQPDTLPETAYIDALLSDLTQEVPLVWGRTISSVFIGGGTPSLFSAEAIDRLLSGLRALMALPAQTEITMEANPGTFEQQKFIDFRKAGVNRLSIGIQSFNSTHLQSLGRIHGREESLRACDIARQAGFDNINLDLMFGLPSQTLDDALQDIQTACEQKPEHISHYQLTLEPNTLFYKYPPVVPEDEALWVMQEQTASLLQQAGYERYEISAWCQPGKRSVHNSNYWLFGDYLGIGAGAHGKISFADSGKILRRSKQRHPTRYLESAASEQRISQEHELKIEDTPLEFMMNALRLVNGFSPQLYHLHTGLFLDSCQGQLDRAIENGLLQQTPLAIKPTEKGLDFLNDLLQHFMQADSPSDEQTGGDPAGQVFRYPTIPIQKH